MFLFARKTKTPISTYTDSFRPPNSMRKTFQEAPMTLWKENKFVTEWWTLEINFRHKALTGDQSRRSLDSREKLFQGPIGEMFIFAHKTKTPVSTYTESYRPPGTVKQTYREPPLALLEDNKFITEGLTVPRVENQVNQAHLEKMIKHAVQEYSYKNTTEPTAYRPEKYWVTRPEEKHNPVFVSGDKYATWRTGPYNSAGWNKYTTYLPRLPKEAGMETILRGMPMQYPPKPDRLNNYEREVVVNMLNSLSRSQLPSVQHRTVIPGRKPFQGYYSPCSGRHYCLRGMDYYVDGAPCNERQLDQLVEKIVRNIPYYDCSQETMGYAPSHSPPPSFPYMNLKWDTSHFQKAGGPQKDNYVIHPEFVSESYPTSPCW